jgi:hypothetical protein
MRPLSICTRLLLLVPSMALTSCGSLALESPTATPTRTPTPTATIAFPTLIPTAVSTPPASPTAAPALTAASGPLLFQARFTSDEGWLVGIDADGGASLSGESLTIAVSRPSASRYVPIPAPQAGDFLLEATVRANLCTEGDEVGVLVRVSPQEDHYRFTLSCNGTARLTRVLGTSAAILAGPTVASSAIPGSPSENRLTVLARGPEFTFFINGAQVLQARDTLLVSGGFGFFVHSAGQGQTTAALTSLTLRALEPDAMQVPTPAPD